MTKILYDPQNLMLSIQGHSGYAKAGSDIVCAAVSIVSYMLEESLKEDEQLNAHCHRDVRDATFTAECYPTYTAREKCKTLMGMAVNGLRMLAEEYPKHVTIEERDLRYFM